MIQEAKNPHFQSTRLDGRWIILVVAVLYVSMVTLLIGPLHAGRVNVLRALGIPALEVPFSDTVCVANWCDGATAGKDPYAANFKDDSGTVIPMNYPQIILSLRWLGLTRNSTGFFGVMLGMLFFLSFLLLCGRCSMKQGGLWALALCSPSVLMAVERGNLDILVFAFLTMALLLRRSPVLSAGFILMASILKLYPIAACEALCGKREARRTLYPLTFGIFALYLWLICPQLNHILFSLGSSFSCSFGAKVPAVFLAAKGMFPHLITGWGLQLFALLSGLGFFVGGFLLGEKGSAEPRDERAVYSFWIGAPILLLLFLSGSQCDYKLITALFVMPIVLAWHRQGGSLCMIPRLWTACFLIYSYWLFFSDEGSPRNFLFRQGIGWGLFWITALMAGILLIRKNEDQTGGAGR